jgi:uncharacterized OB-fold protein
MNMTSYSKPLPIIDEDTAPYWKYCKQHELRMQKCSDCGHIRFPASVLCPACHSMDAQWMKLSGKGKIFSYVVFRQAYHPAYKGDIPYVVAIIQLEEGPRMESNIIDADVDEIEIGMSVKLVFDDVTDSISLPKFKLVKKA